MREPKQPVKLKKSIPVTSKVELLPLSAFSPLVRHAVSVFDGGVYSQSGSIHQDLLAAEVPVALVFNGISHVVMMVTPQDLEVFALGFALSEGIVLNSGEVRGVDVVEADATQAGLPPGIAALEVHIEVSARSFEQLKMRKRAMAGRTGCGVCGVESLSALDLLASPVSPSQWAAHIDAALVLRAFSQLQKLQPLNAESGSLHAAGWATLDGELLHVFEDVGRHNALDKLLGQRLLDRLAFDDGFVVMSSRASYELVLKCARLGVPTLATISAPTSLAVQIAQQAGMQLYGFCRGERAVAYHASPSASLLPGPAASAKPVQQPAR